MLTGGALENATSILDGLSVDEARMRANLDLLNGLIMSEAVMMGLATRIGRVTAHDVVYDAAMAASAETLYTDNCAACHGENGQGDVFQGAPNLTDAIWLYGGSEEALTETVTYSRFGVMPPWENRLTDAQIRAVTAYVHQLGGGQ